MGWNSRELQLIFRESLTIAKNRKEFQIDRAEISHFLSLPPLFPSLSPKNNEAHLKYLTEITRQIHSSDTQYSIMFLQETIPCWHNLFKLTGNLRVNEQSERRTLLKKERATFWPLDLFDCGIALCRFAPFKLSRCGIFMEYVVVYFEPNVKEYTGRKEILLPDLVTSQWGPCLTTTIRINNTNNNDITT